MQSHYGMGRILKFKGSMLNEISVASGKGGTGKTTIATALALSVGYCQFFDFDVEAPNASLFLKPDIKHIQKVKIKQPVIF